ncbi:MAG: extensin family protein [Myxococcota bacterium]
MTYRKRRDGAPMVVACALAERLPRLSALLREHDIRRVEVLSAYRREPAVSYHHMGLALDITAFVRASDVLHVERDWPELRGPTCSTRPEDDSGRVLHAVVCAMHRSQIFSTVITPSYGRGHDNHLHVDIRPGDTWRFLR